MKTRCSAFTGSNLRTVFLVHRIAAARRHAPRVVRLAAHKYISMEAHFNTGEDPLGRENLDFFAQLK